METKKHIRKILQEKRDFLPKSIRKEYSRCIFERLIALPRVKNAENILIYRNFKSEVETEDLIGWAFREGKNVYCPKVLSGEKMEFFRIFDGDDFCIGALGIREPMGKERYEEKKDTVMILPMVGFDLFKYRIGYGKGYYDRYLEKKTEIYKIGIAFEEQCVKEGIIRGSFDVPADLIVTEQRMI